MVKATKDLRRVIHGGSKEELEKLLSNDLSEETQETFQTAANTNQESFHTALGPGSFDPFDGDIFSSDLARKIRFIDQDDSTNGSLISPHSSSACSPIQTGIYGQRIAYMRQFLPSFIYDENNDISDCSYVTCFDSKAGSEIICSGEDDEGLGNEETLLITFDQEATPIIETCELPKLHQSPAQTNSINPDTVEI